MKVLSLVTNRYATFYVKQSDLLRKNGVTLTHISPRQQNPNYREQQDISRSIADYAAMYPSLLRESLNGYDIVHVNNGKVAPFALAQPRRPIILTLWGSDLMSDYRRISRMCSEYFDKVIVPSPKMSSYLSCEHTVIPFGVDTEVFKPINKYRARNIIDWPQNETIVLFPYPKTRTIKRYKLAKQVVNSLNINAKLYHPSGVPHDKMPLYYNAADVVLITSKRESGPMVVKEAALCNTPVVSTNVGFVSEVLSDVNNSYVCGSEKEFTDHLDKVLQSGAQSNGRNQLIEEVSLERMAERIIDVYKHALR